MIGYMCTVEALTLSLLAYFTISKYRQVPSEDEADLFPERGRELSPMSTHITYDDVHNNHQHHHHIDAEKIDGYAFNNHNNNCNKTISSPECNQKPYIPGKSEFACVRNGKIQNVTLSIFRWIEKRPDQANNRRPTLGHIHSQKPNNRYRQGYHYQPVASTSQLSPTFVFGESNSIRSTFDSIRKCFLFPISQSHYLDHHTNPTIPQARDNVCFCRWNQILMKKY